ncbi:MAG TPA: hypothetical protein GXZ76_04830 [Clostridiaceae bacterium]|nr:hypothetical protein [Clostridiaceae bacterium]
MIDQYKIFKDNIQSLKKISEDTTNHEFMCELEIEAVNFDMVKRMYVNSLYLSEDNSKSVDALLFHGENSIFIEFKNGDMHNQKREVKEKIKDSLLIFCDIIDKNISHTRKKLDFVLVYNSEKNPKSVNLKLITDHLNAKANREEIRFGLEEYPKLYFNNIHTYDKIEFENYIKTTIF